MNTATTLSPSPCSNGTPPCSAIAAIEQLVVAGDSGAHRLGRGLLQTRRALEVGQHEPHCADREVERRLPNTFCAHRGIPPHRRPARPAARSRLSHRQALESVRFLVSVEDLVGHA